MKLQIVNFASFEDVIKYNYNGETPKLSLTFKSTTDRQTSICLQCNSDVLRHVLSLTTDLLYCEDKTSDANLVKTKLFVYSDTVYYSNVGNVKSQTLLELTLRKRGEDENLSVTFPKNSRIFTNLQYR